MKKLITLFGAILILGACNNTQKTLEEQAAAIHSKILTVDSHTDTPLDFVRSDFELRDRHNFSEDRSRLDFPRMKEGGLDAVFMAAFTGQRKRDKEGNEKAYNYVIETIDSIHSQLARNTDIAGLAEKPEDAYRLHKENKRAVFIGIENGYPVGNDINKVQTFFDLGARYITLCHTRNNDICDSSTDTTEHNGLSEFGVEVVKEMNRLGMMIDVSHISDSSFFDVIGLSNAPVIASHSCARAICDNPRNLTDDMLKALAENGGVIQMCILSDYVKTPPPYPERDSAKNAVRVKYNNFESLSAEERKLAIKDWYAVDSIFPRPLATVSETVDHIDHMVEVAGIEHVGIGTDFDGGGGLSDCQDVSQMGNITLELVKRGYTEEEIALIWGGNIMRVMSEVLALADDQEN